MSKNNPFADMLKQSDLTKILENFQANPFDVKSFMETQRKNMQALSEAQKMSIEGMQAIAQRQSEIMSQMVEDNSSLAKEIMSEGTPEEKIAKNADIFKSVYERTVSNMRELSDMINKSNIEASNIINKRVSASINEIKSSLESAKKSEKKAA